MSNCKLEVDSKLEFLITKYFTSYNVTKWILRYRKRNKSLYF
jgi:hypothetical protein